MYSSRAMLGSGVFSDGYEVGSKRQRMIDSHPYFAVSGGTSSYQPHSYGGGFNPSLPVVRLRGLPFDCTDIDILNFFGGLETIDVLLVNKNGRFTGEAFVVFTNNVQSELALQKDRQNMGRRYVEVFRCNKQEYYRAVAAEVKYDGIYDEFHNSPVAKPSKKAPDTSKKPADASKKPADASKKPAEKDKKKDKDKKEQLDYTEILKLRGLPYSVTTTDIVEFFDEFELAEDNVHIGSRPDGKATGEAYVEFESVDDAKKAMVKDKMTIGSRYVELFPSSLDEARRAKSRSRQ